MENEINKKEKFNWKEIIIELTVNSGQWYQL